MPPLRRPTHPQALWQDRSEGAWEVDHSKPRAKGGTDHGNNLRAACITCNRSKQDMPTGVVRKANGMRGVPESKSQRIARERQELVDALVAGLLIGLGSELIRRFFKPKPKSEPSCVVSSWPSVWG